MPTYKTGYSNTANAALQPAGVAGFGGDENGPYGSATIAEQYPATHGGVTGGALDGLNCYAYSNAPSSRMRGGWRGGNGAGDGHFTRIDVAPGTYDLVLCAGQVLGGYSTHVAVYDGESNTPLFSAQVVSNTGGDVYVMDAMGNKLALSDWDAQNQKRRVTITSDHVRVQFGDGGLVGNTDLIAVDLLDVVPVVVPDGLSLVLSSDGTTVAARVHQTNNVTRAPVDSDNVTITPSAGNVSAAGVIAKPARTLAVQTVTISASMPDPNGTTLTAEPVTYQVPARAAVPPALVLGTGSGAQRRVVRLAVGVTVLPTIAPVPYANSGDGGLAALGAITAEIPGGGAAGIVAPLVNADVGQIEFAAGPGFAAWCAYGGRAVVIPVLVRARATGDLGTALVVLDVSGASAPGSPPFAAAAEVSPVVLRYDGDAAAVGDVPVVASTDPTVATGTASPLVAGADKDFGRLLSTLTVQARGPGTATVTATIGTGDAALAVSVPVSVPSA